MTEDEVLNVIGRLLDQYGGSEDPRIRDVRKSGHLLLFTDSDCGMDPHSSEPQRWRIKAERRYD